MNLDNHKLIRWNIIFVDVLRFWKSGGIFVLQTKLFKSTYERCHPITTKLSSLSDQALNCRFITSSLFKLLSLIFLAYTLQAFNPLRLGASFSLVIYLKIGALLLKQVFCESYLTAIIFWSGNEAKALRDHCNQAIDRILRYRAISLLSFTTSRLIASVNAGAFFC